MAGLAGAIGMAIAGGIKGYGDHALAKGLEAREARLKELEHRRSMQMQDRRLAHQSEENRLDREQRAALAGGKASQTDKQIGALVARGISQKDAEDIAYGIAKIKTDNISGQHTITNIADGTERPLVFQDGNQQTAQNSARSIFSGEPLTSDPNKGQPVELLSTDPDANTGQRSQAQSLYSMADDATGLLPAISEIYTNIGGQIPGMPEIVDPNTVDKRQQFMIAQQALVRALVNNPRFPVGEMDRIREEVDIAPSILKSGKGLRQKMQAVDKGLRVRLQNMEAISNDRQMPTEARQAARSNVANIRNFLAILGVPQNAENGNRSRNQAPDPNIPSNLEDPRLWQHMTPEERRRWIELSGGQ